MDSREAQNTKTSSSQDKSDGQFVQTTSLTKALLQQLEMSNQESLMIERWLGETPEEEPFNGPIVTRSTR
ncbi:hypothetical protein MKX08_007677 [Trichoderma sp. CBMAI-0020]|nr:hypothetical protein MKX08_007677 [Trichoderma sp. CBMAI-0020]